MVYSNFHCVLSAYELVLSLYFVSLQTIDVTVYQKNEWSYMVEPQKTQIIEAGEHSRIRFSEKIDDEGYYIVFSWGDGPELLEELDIRGH